MYKMMVLMLISLNAYSLEIDEKLTVRVKGVSESGKTMLVNRGIEDGLAVGDHAKFYVSLGVVARGVIIKASPTRTVWSVYRLVNKEFIRDDQVLKLKITPAVKITKDETKMLVKDDISESVVKDPRDLGIPLADGADDLALNGEGKSMGVGGSSQMMNMGSVDLKAKNREVFGMFNYSSYTEETTSDNDDKYTQDVTNLYLKLGGEWYFRSESDWYSKLSFQGYFAIDRKAVMTAQGAFTKEEGSEFGFGVSLHPTTMPSKVQKLIPYLNYTLALGSVSSQYVSGNESGLSDKNSADSSVFSHSFGFGAKYYTMQGIGARFELDYYLRGDQSGEDSDTFTWTKTRSGPRFLFGLSYRL